MLRNCTVGSNNIQGEILGKKIVKFNGGLGNQMFQYAFSYALSKHLNVKVLLDFWWFEAVKTHKNVTPRKFELDAFNIEYEVATDKDLGIVVKEDKRSVWQKISGDIFKVKKHESLKNIFLEKTPFFDKSLFVNPKYYYYDGYFQNEKYFKTCRKDLLKIFCLKQELDVKNQQILENVKNLNSVSIHVRRGDYVTLECAKNYHGVCPLEYYEKAIKYIAKQVQNPHFFLFSDDIEWVAKNLKIDYPFTVVNFNQGQGWLDLELMKNCKHNIIANSSFSWWGAWLNENPNKIVVAPKNWTAQKNKKCDIIPKKWIKL